MAPNGFDLEKIRSEFTAALLEDGRIDLDHYLKGHAEITRLFELLGTVFGFVSSDMKTKCGIMNHHRADRPANFATVQSMVEYEMREDLTSGKNEKGLDGGSRTFLRLHRALEFLCLLLTRLAEAADADAVSTLASTAYGETLGKYHPWVVRQMAYLAMKTLPNKKQLIIRYCKQEQEEAARLVPVTVEAMKNVYDIAQNLFNQHNLLQLP